MFVGLLNLYIVSYPAGVRQIMSYEIYLPLCFFYFCISLVDSIIGELSLYL